MVFKTVASDATKSGRAVALFGKELRLIRDDFKATQGNFFQKVNGAFATADQKDLAALKNFTMQIEKGESKLWSFNQTMSGASATAREQAKEIGRLNTLYRARKLDLETYNTKVNEVMASTQKLTIAQRLAATASKALGIALNTALNVGIMIAINAIISGIMHLVNRQQEAIDKAKESAEAIKQETDVIDEYIQKTIELRKKLDEENVSLDESKDIRSELRDIQKDLIEKYGEEARGIDLVTGSIEEQIQALYDLNKAKFEDSYQLNKEGYDAARKQVQSANAAISVSRILADGFGASHDDDVEALRDFISSEFAKRGYSYRDNGGDTTDVSLNIWEKSADMYTIDEELAEIYEQIENYSKYGSQAVKDAANTSLTYISQIRRDWSNKTVTDNEELYAQWLKYDSDYSDEYINIVRKQANLEYAIESGNAEEITKAKEEFAELYQNTVDEAIKNGDTDVAKYLEKIFGDVAKSSKETSSAITTKYVPSVQKLTDAYEDLEEQIEKILDLQNKLSDAFERVASGEVFSAEEVYNLVKDLPELYKYVIPVEGGFTFSYEGLEKAYDAQNDELLNKIKETNKENQEAIDYYNEQKRLLEEYEKNKNNSAGFKMLENGFNPDGVEVAREEAEAAQEEIEKNNALLDILNTSLDSHAKILAGITTQYETAKDEIDDFNSKISTIDKAITSMNEGEALTYDEMAALVEISPALNSAFTKQEDGYYIAIDSLTALREESNTTRNSYIDDLIAMAKATKRELGSKITSYYGYISYMPEINAWQEYIDRLTALRGDVYDDSSKNSSSKDTISDELQNQIDYYDKIIQGIEAVADERIEAIDKEIEAINEQRDALEEQNDERQRELDLIEAQNNLEKAKKQKVFVYKEGEGLVQVQDEKAVKEAQQELDDARREIKEAEYDKQIELLEKQSEAIEDYKSGYSDMKSDIEDAIAVEQAKVALGTDENGLLNLSPETTDNLRDGLAEAIVEKDKHDNKDNPYYKDFTLADMLKKLGSTATPEEFKAAFQPALNYNKPLQAYDVQGKSNYQYVTNNNGTTNFTATFNITGTANPNEVADVVKLQICDLLQKYYNKKK